MNAPALLSVMLAVAPAVIIGSLPVQLPTIPDGWTPIALAVAISVLVGAFVKFGTHRTTGLQTAIGELEDSNERLKKDLAAERARSALLEQVIQAERAAKDREYLRAQKYWRLIVLHRDSIPGAEEALRDE